VHLKTTSLLQHIAQHNKKKPPNSHQHGICKKHKVENQVNFESGKRNQANLHYICITLIISITMLCGIDNNPQNMWEVWIECGEHQILFCEIMSLLWNIVMDLNNVMSKVHSHAE
jgi:hypothetical protein